MKLRLTSMTAGLAIGITAAVAIACAAGAYFYSVHHFQTLLDNERSTALAQGELMRVALEHQMIENDRSLIAAVTRCGTEGGHVHFAFQRRLLEFCARHPRVAA